MLCSTIAGSIGGGSLIRRSGLAARFETEGRSLPSPCSLPIIGIDETQLEILRPPPRQARRGEGHARRLPLLRMAGLRGARALPGAQGPRHEGEYHRFCLEHVREYNKSYNYFAGMPDEDVVKHQKDDTIGHRPTWFVGVNSWARNRATRNGEKPQRLCLSLRHP